MTQYTDVYVNISDTQRKKLKDAIDAGCATMTLNLKNTDLRGGDKLALTHSQANKLQKAIERGKRVTFRMSKKQLKHNLKIEGGFLGLLAGLAARALPMLARTVLAALGVGALSGLASSGVQKAMGNGLYFKKGGLIARVETDGRGLYLSPYKGKGLNSYGNGLYLKQGGNIYEGKGLLLGPSSPFSKIPILGAIL